MYLSTLLGALEMISKGITTPLDTTLAVLAAITARPQPAGVRLGIAPTIPLHCFMNGMTALLDRCAPAADARTIKKVEHITPLNEHDGRTANNITLAARRRPPIATLLTHLRAAPRPR
jgi:hypothetical protein